MASLGSILFVVVVVVIFLFLFSEMLPPPSLPPPSPYAVAARQIPTYRTCTYLTCRVADLYYLPWVPRYLSYETTNEHDDVQLPIWGI